MNLDLYVLSIHLKLVPEKGDAEAGADPDAEPTLAGSSS